MSQINNNNNNSDDTSKPLVLYANDYFPSFTPSERVTPGDYLLQHAHDSPQVFSHRCYLFNVVSLLFDQRWLGADGVKVELTHSDPNEVQKICQLFEEALKKTSLEAKLQIKDQTRSLLIDEIRFENRVSPDYILELADLCLLVEPNKVDRLSSAEIRVFHTNSQHFSTQLAEEITYIQLEQRALLRTLKVATQSMTTDYEKAGLKNKGEYAFLVLQKRCNQLKELLQQQQQIKEIETCSVCERIVRIYSAAVHEPSTVRPLGQLRSLDELSQMQQEQHRQLKEYLQQRQQQQQQLQQQILLGNNNNSSSSSNHDDAEEDKANEIADKAATLDEIVARIALFENKIKEASGVNNKQKRKRLQRKLKELRDLYLQRLHSS